MKSIHNEMRILLIGLFLTSCAAFGSLPFLSLYLKEYKLVSLASIGVIITIPYLINSIFAFIGGKICDMVGTKIIPVACFGIGVGFLLYSFFASIMGLILASIIIGFSKSFYEPSIKALLSKENTIPSDQIFRLRYLAICGGAVLGPVIGGALYKSNAKSIFIFTFIVYFCFAIILRLFIDIKVEKKEIKDEVEIQKFKLREWVSPFTDKKLMLLIVAGILGFIILVSFESILPLALSEVTDDVASIFSIIFSVSAGFGILMQVLLSFMSKKLNQRVLLLIGNLSFALGFLIFSKSSGIIVFLLIGTLFYAAGESIVIPYNDILISNIAPENKKASYFGVAEIRQLGFSIGPIIGTMSLEYFHHEITLYIISAFAVVGALLYLLVKFEPQKVEAIK